MKRFAVLISFVFQWYYRLLYGSHITFGKDVIVDHKLKFRGPGKLIIEDGVNLWTHKEPNEFYTYDGNAIIHIGARSRINGVQVHCKQSVTFGPDCLAGSCTLLDTDFHSIRFEERKDPSKTKSSPIAIGAKVWLGGQSAILKGVTVGERAVIAFRAVVSRDVPASSVVAGNPATVVKELARGELASPHIQAYT